MPRINTDILDNLIVGRVEPHIYAFTTGTVPNYLKVGDTYRPVSIRISEWSTKYPDLNHIYTESAQIDDNTIFRDHSVHKFLITQKSRRRLLPEDMPSIPYYSNEFFEGATTVDVDEAIKDIRDSAKKNDGRYTLYTPAHLPILPSFTRGESFIPRPNQQEVIDNFEKAIALGRKKLLMFAVMRFGKSFTSMCCAKSMDAKLVLVVSAKVDVRDEWKKTVQSIGNFEGYIFASRNDLLSSSDFLQQSLKDGNRIVLFLSLQDLQGDDMKDCHKQVFNLNWDLLIVDETHFGARAAQYGKVLANKKTLTTAQINAENERQLDDVDTLDKLEDEIKEIRRNISIHLSGTPYRILMGDEFDKEDIIAFVQFSDIAEAQQKWIEEHKNISELKEIPEWENPYFGFPQMIRFAFNPNQTSQDKIAELKAQGATTSFAELFRPKSLTASNTGFKKFVHEDVVLDFLKVIDGSKNDTNVLGFLDNERIKTGKLCRHIVIVLPYCASCDALEELLKTRNQEFRNLSDYEILNISGLTRNRVFSNTAQIKSHITDCESKGKKTITLTVNRMLTGNTVPEWDTMIFLKQCSSAEEYDQAVFRLQNSYIKEFVNAENEVIKVNMKPQTILVDFDPERVFRLQERKSQIYNINTEINGNSRLRERIETELRISPIITLDHNKLREVTVTNIVDAVRNYAETRSVLEEASDVPIDLSLLDNIELRNVISSMNRIDAKNGFEIPVHSSKENDGDDTNPTISKENQSEQNASVEENNAKPSAEKEDDIAKKFASYYALILFFAFLTEDTVASLEDIIKVLEVSENNIRISKNLGLKKEVLQIIQDKSKGNILSALDYKIQNTNDLNHDVNKSPLERVSAALTKFGRMSDSEIVTPLNLADDVVKLLPEDVFSYGPILDIASKQGEFTIALLKRYGGEVSNKIYSICTSKLAYEFTRKVYKLLSLPIEHIFDSFTSYDLIKKDRNNNFDIPQVLTQMKFSTIIGNPPYQEVKATEKASSNAAFASALYPLFIEMSRKVTYKYVALITPSRWMTRQGQGISNEWVDEMLSRNDIETIHDYPNASDCFPRVDIKGGINYFLMNINYNGKTNFVSHKNGEMLGTIRILDEFGAGVVVRDPFAKEIIEKIIVRSPNYLQKNSFASMVSPKHYFDRNELLSSNWRGYSLIKDSEHDIKYYLNRNLVKEGYAWISKDDIPKGHTTIPINKIYLPMAGGTGNDPQIIGVPFYGEPNSVCSYTYLVIGYDAKRHNFSFDECQNILRYMKTKFFRYMVSVKKKTQNTTRDLFQFVPLQNFTKGSDIDWSKSVAEIDAQLYAKYHLSDKEITFIESMIKPISSN